MTYLRKKKKFIISGAGISCILSMKLVHLHQVGAAPESKMLSPTGAQRVRTECPTFK